MTKFLKLIVLFAVMLTTSTALATGEVCTGYNPLNQSQCLGWEPSLLPSAAWVNGTTYNPDSSHVVICTGLYFNGYCQVLPVNYGVNPLSQVGWNTTTSNPTQHLQILSIKVGAGRSIVLWNPVPNSNCGQNGVVCHTVTANMLTVLGWNFDALYVQ